MRVAGSRSWGLTFDVGQLPHVALFTRDALAVQAKRSDRLDAPRLMHKVPDRSALIAGHDRPEAASAWQAWWTMIITTPRGETSQRTPDASPTLRRAVRELHRDACAWFEEHRDPWIPPRRDPGRDWPIAKSAAEAAASDRGVSLDVHAETQLLLVDGNWWQRPAPGVLFYSPAVYVDDIQLHQLLRETFVSSV